MGAGSGKLLLTGDSGMMFSRSRSEDEDDDEVPWLLFATGPQMLGGARPSSTWISRALNDTVSDMKRRQERELDAPPRKQTARRRRLEGRGTGPSPSARSNVSVGHDAVLAVARWVG